MQFRKSVFPEFGMPVRMMSPPSEVGWKMWSVRGAHAYLVAVVVMAQHHLYDVLLVEFGIIYFLIAHSLGFGYDAPYLLGSEPLVYLADVLA